MPTLQDDTVDFKVATLNDLLEADARSGVAVGGADEGRYRRWAYLSTAAAGLFAILFVVALVTGGGDDGDEGGEAQAAEALDELPAGTAPYNVSVPGAQITSSMTPGSKVDVYDASSNLVVDGAQVVKVGEENDSVVANFGQRTVEIAVTDEQRDALRAAGEDLSIEADTGKNEPAAAEAPAAEQAPAEPAPAEPAPAAPSSEPLPSG
ncbi:MAG: hypothetical protein ACRDY7_08595 [Acidimicrobiia bacterium]